MVVDINECYGLNLFNIMVYNNDYMQYMRLMGYIDVEFNEEFGFNVGIGIIIIFVDYLLVKCFMQVYEDVVLIMVEYNGWYWIGCVDFYVVLGKLGCEIIIFILIDDKIQLVNILVFVLLNMSFNVQKKCDY